MAGARIQKGLSQGMKAVLRLTGQQHEDLKRHLFPGDGREAVALVRCGRLAGSDPYVLCAHEILRVPHEVCRVREPDLVYWPPQTGHALYERAAERSMAILKVHSHPAGYDKFSIQDDRSDKELFQALHGWTDDGLPHASAVMLPSGRMFGRLVDRSCRFHVIERIAIAGDEILFFDADPAVVKDETQLRTSQAFGDRTTTLLKKLKIGIVGCSGTGSWVIEQLARLGVGHLVLVDPDIVERKNLNRVVNTQLADTEGVRQKVLALAEALGRHGTGTVVTPIGGMLFDKVTARALASCDVVFGCMDKFEGRDRLNRIASFYLVPYFDLGVRLDADGEGGISNVSGTVNYMLPDGSSLLSRGCYSPKTLREEVLRRTNPDQYRQEADDGYIKNAKVDSPAVISVNGFCASMAVNELLARIHPYRDGKLAEERRQQFDLKNSFWMQLDDTSPCPVLSKHAGRGDMEPFLNCTGHA